MSVDDSRRLMPSASANLTIFADTNQSISRNSAAALTEQCYFRYGIADDKITLLNPASGFASKICNNSDVLSLSTSPGTFTTAATLSTACFDIVRYTLTKNFKYIPNSYSKYISSYKNKYPSDVFLYAKRINGSLGRYYYLMGNMKLSIKTLFKDSENANGEIC